MKLINKSNAMLTDRLSMLFTSIMDKLKYLKFFLSLLIFIFMLTTLKGQSNKEQFDEFKKQHKLGYNQFVDQIDDEFADALRKHWVNFQIHAGHEVSNKPKPVAFPKSHKIVSDPVELGVNFQTPDSIDFLEELIMPVNYKTDTYTGNQKSTRITFFGDQINIKYYNDFQIELGNKVSTDGIADFWKTISQSSYMLMINELLASKQKYALNDYGYYLLTKTFCASVLTSENEIKLLTWFILSKSKYKVKIGYNSDELFLLLSSKRKVYGKNYFVHDKVTYYVMDYKGGQLFSYENNYPDAYKTLDFSVRKPIRLKEDIKTKAVALKYKGQDFAFNFEYNKNAIDFYQAIPSIELDGYFNAEVTLSTQKSLIANLQPIIKDMQELEAVNFLLTLVQNGFDYQIDETQFGTEKVFFPEEILHFPFSDCEDRSVFFAYLVNTLLGNEVVGLDYPAHVATAVHFNQEIPGDFIIHEGKKYIVCDPTYVNAPVGISMRDLSNFKADIIRKENNELTWSAMQHVKKNLNIKGELASPKIITVNKGIVMAANYSQNIMIQGKSIDSTDQGLLLAHFKIDNQLLWVKTIDHVNKLHLVELSIDSKDNTLALYQNETSKIYQLSRLNGSGEILWTRAVSNIDSVVEGANTQVTLFDEKGQKLAGKTYRETQFFDGKPLAVRNGNIVVILPSQL